MLKIAIGVPLYGYHTYVQRVATDAMAVFKDTTGAQRYAISPKGHPTLRIYTTKPTTGLTKGEIFLLFHNSTPKIGICYSTAANGIKMVRARTKTLGRLTA